MQTLAKKPFYLVGHRGLPEHYPENTLSGILAAIAEGADGVEFDIQISKDAIPVVIHDDTLVRTTGISGELAEYTFSLLERISAHEPARLGQSHLPESIPSLASLVHELKKWPEVHAFAEIKNEIFKRQNREKTLQSIAAILEPIKAHCSIISFDYEILSLARKRGFSIGWVLDAMTETTQAAALALAPEFLIIEYGQIPSSGPWPGPWHWFVYDITHGPSAQRAIDQGITYIESWDVRGLKEYFDAL
ncbi:MAG TPA: glycerophosphodiester phosphodiesterase family protein [Cellvibrionaceae bacterium]|nr:glycerophosphodiester phosphodiesterase family protein [Cellvibrionaceae bacterium]